MFSDMSDVTRRRDEVSFQREENETRKSASHSNQTRMDATGDLLLQILIYLKLKDLLFLINLQKFTKRQDSLDFFI